MQAWKEMQEYVGFDEADQARLVAFWPEVAPRVTAITDHFYERILSHPPAAGVFSGPEQVDRLKQTLKVWIRELLCGPWDEAYYRRRERIGHVHVRVGLPSRYMFTAMSVFRDDLIVLAQRTRHGEEMVALCGALRRVSEIDLAVMTGTYMEAREERQLAHVNELIVSFMPVTVLLTDGAGVVVMATRSAEALLGGEDPEGQHYTRVLPAELVDAATLDVHVQRALATEHEIALLRVDALIAEKARQFRLNIVPLRHPSARLLLHVEEVTDAVETETRLQRSEALAHLGALSASVAHELRNPLAGISGAIQIIRRSLPDDDRRASVLDRVEQQIQRLNALVSDLLDFARPGTARLTQVDLADIARQVLALVVDDHPGVRIAIVGEGRATGDPNLTHQILLNLVQNALQAVGDTGAIEVRVGPGRVVVADSGPGVPEDLGQSIFTPFFTTRTRGTGLGLAVCRRAARTMGAEVEVLAERPLGGAAFALSFEG